MNSYPSVDAMVGKQLRKLREDAQVPQESIAMMARRWGLRWSRSQVAMIETGRRGLTLGEWWILPHVLTEALGRDPHRNPITYKDLLPTENGPVSLTPELSVDHSGVLEILRSNEGKMVREGIDHEVHFHTPHAKQLRYLDDASWNAAQSLHVPTLAVVKAAELTWGRPFSEERDRRLPPDAKPEEASALRGHITRALIKELRPVLFEMGVKPKSSKKKGGRSKRKKQ